MAKLNRPYKSGTTVTYGDGTEDGVWNVLSGVWNHSKSLTANVTASVMKTLAPFIDGAFTVTRLVYVKCAQPTLTNSAAVTDAAVFGFDAAAGTHKAVDGATTKTTPGTVNAWVKIDMNGTIYYMPAYTSKTT